MKSHLVEMLNKAIIIIIIIIDRIGTYHYATICRSEGVAAILFNLSYIFFINKTCIKSYMFKK